MIKLDVIMDYEKILKEALNSKATPFEVSSWIEEQFPELKESEDESEDERMRKGIVKYLEQSQFGEEHYCVDDDIVREYIDWLEKHKEEDSYTHRKTQEFMKGFKRVQCYEELSEWEKMFDNIASKYANRKNDEGYNNSWFVKERAGDMLYYAKQEIERQNNQKLDAIDISEEQKDKLQEENLNAHPELLNPHNRVW